MPRDVVALVSADDFVSAVRVYTDRVNDLLRRGGVPALEAIETCETHSLALLDAVVNAPETVIDLAGWWFARAIEMATQTGRTSGDEASDEPISMLAGTANEEQVREALGRLPAAERTAVMLRDGYDLPNQAVGVALRRGSESAAELIAGGRLDLVAAYDDRVRPNLAGHSGRTTVDLVTLSMLADGTLESPRAAPLRRHVGNCAACEDVLEALAKGRRLAAGLPIIAMDDDARQSMIDRIASRAEAVLPSHDLVLRAVDEDHDPGPIVHPVLAIAIMVLALTLGIGIAALTHANNGPSPLPPTANTFQPTDTPLFSPPPVQVPTRRSRTAIANPSITPTRQTSVKPRHSQTPTAEPTTSAPVAPHGRPRITLSPSRGRRGTTITVTGSGFPADSPVRITYGQRAAESSAQTDSTGAFVGQVQATALLPNSYSVTARAGNKSASATFQQTL
ncbi:MAG: IPT/TIG domain-containing protein [Frankiaceae bacterium]|nr:IPT/TIG domain-containing protein [Frankiaceae bacterium]MBV9872676.1 IPT/TIG domain-containing protein [Frankiaceae bacterium]